MAVDLDMVPSAHQTVVNAYAGTRDVDSWFLMGSPFAILTIAFCYLAFVLKIGPNYMATRTPLSLQKTLIIYNAFLVVFSLWVASRFFTSGLIRHVIQQGCAPFSPALSAQFSEMTWWYMFSKVVELLDTVFIVLRKKQKQVTFLHLYHHTMMMLSTWAYFKYSQAEMIWNIGFLNSTVHGVMYTYYLLAALGPRYRKYLWWKKSITWMQLGQFTLMLAYILGVLYYDCECPKLLSYYYIFNACLFIVLFTHFYLQTYKSTKNPS